MGSVLTFVTAWARYRLHQGYKLARAIYPGTTHETFVYADTDSLKTRTELDFTRFNNLRIKAAKQSGAYAPDAKGKMHYMGVFESEGRYDLFRTLGAKRYCIMQEKWCHLKKKPCPHECIYNKSFTEITVAGVPLEEGSKELIQRGGIANFTWNFVFHDSGKTRAVYQDDIDLTIQRDGHELHITRCVVIVDADYALDICKSYVRMGLLFMSYLDTVEKTDYNRKW